MRSPAACSHRSLAYCAPASTTAISEHDRRDGGEQPRVGAVERERRLRRPSTLVDDERERPRLGEVGERERDRRAAGAGQRLPAPHDVRAQHPAGRREARPHARASIAGSATQVLEQRGGPPARRRGRRSPGAARTRAAAAARRPASRARAAPAPARARRRAARAGGRGAAARPPPASRTARAAPGAPERTTSSAVL